MEGVAEVSERRRGMSRDDLDELLAIARSADGRVTGAFPLGIPAPDGTWGVPSYWGRIHIHFPHARGVDLSDLIAHTIDRGHVIKVFPYGVPVIDEIRAVVEAGGLLEQG
jgi:hypothetical protein